MHSHAREYASPWIISHSQNSEILLQFLLQRQTETDSPKALNPPFTVFNLQLFILALLGLCCCKDFSNCGRRA